jgi:hypothetical protein
VLRGKESIADVENRAIEPRSRKPCRASRRVGDSKMFAYIGRASNKVH